MPKKRIAILVASIAVALVPILADRTVAGLAADRLAARLSCLAGDPGDVDVSLGGFPFLTQMASGTFDDIRVRADRATFRNLTLNSIDVTAHGVRLPEGDKDGEASADSLQIEAVVPFASLATTMSREQNRDGAEGMASFTGAQLGGDEAGRLTITTALDMRGMQMQATVYAGLAVTDGDLTITPEEIELARFGMRLPASQLPAVASAPRTIELPELPGGVAYEDIAAIPDGLGLTITGHGLRGALRSPITGTTQTNAAEICGATDR